jgi:hypothetical protein
MKFLVRQKLPPGSDVARDHLQPLARVVADSLVDEPEGPVIWLGGWGTVDTFQFTMLFEATDPETMKECLRPLPGVQTVERVMAVDRHTLARGLMLSHATDYEQRMAAEAGTTEE